MKLNTIYFDRVSNLDQVYNERIIIHTDLNRSSTTPVESGAILQVEVM